MKTTLLNVKLALNYDLNFANRIKLKDAGFIELKNLGLQFLLKFNNQDGKLQFSVRKLKINFGRLGINLGKSLPKKVLSYVISIIGNAGVRIARL